MLQSVIFILCVIIMKILHIHPSMKCGGIEAMIYALANEMSKSDEVSVCSIFEPKADDTFWNTLDEKVGRITLHKRIQGFSLSEIFKILKLLWRSSFDVVHVHGFFVYYALSVILLHHRIKFFYTVHSDAKMENNRWDTKFLALKRFCFKHKWIHPITISTASKQSFTDLYGLDSELICNGVAPATVTHKFSGELAKYRFTANTKLFIHVGRIDTPKNQVVLCRSFERLIKEGYDVVLLIAGPIAKQPIFDEMQQYFGNRIVYIGSINESCEYFAHCDAMVLPSIWEGLPVVLLEAMSVGCVPICSPVGGIVNVIDDGKTGFLSNSSSENDVVACLKRFMATTNEEIDVIKRQAIREFQQKYSIDITAKSYLNYYNSFLKL